MSDNCQEVSLFKKRNKFPINIKYEIINKIKDGFNRKEIMKDYNIKSKSHLTELMKNREKIIDKFRNTNNSMGKIVCHIRPSNYPQVEEGLVQWLKQMNIKKMVFNTELIKIKAQELAEEMGFQDFKASHSYLMGFKKRHNSLFVSKPNRTHSEDTQLVTQVTNSWSGNLSDILEERFHEEEGEEEEVLPDPTQMTTVITNTQALYHINSLQNYFCQVGDDSFFEQLIEMQRQVLVNTFKKANETRIEAICE